jgi:hypothetical protein
MKRYEIVTSLIQRINAMILVSNGWQQGCRAGQPDKTMTNPDHGFNLNQYTAKRKLRRLNRRISVRERILMIFIPGSGNSLTGEERAMT